MTTTCLPVKDGETYNVEDEIVPPTDPENNEEKIDESTSVIKNDENLNNEIIEDVIPSVPEEDSDSNNDEHSPKDQLDTQTIEEVDIKPEPSIEALYNGKDLDTLEQEVEDTIHKFYNCYESYKNGSISDEDMTKVIQAIDPDFTFEEYPDGDNSILYLVNLGYFKDHVDLHRDNFILFKEAYEQDPDLFADDYVDDYNELMKLRKALDSVNLQKEETTTDNNPANDNKNVIMAEDVLGTEIIEEPIPKSNGDTDKKNSTAKCEPLYEEIIEEYIPQNNNNNSNNNKNKNGNNSETETDNPPPLYEEIIEEYIPSEEDEDQIEVVEAIEELDDEKTSTDVKNANNEEKTTAIVPVQTQAIVTADHFDSLLTKFFNKNEDNYQNTENTSDDTVEKEVTTKAKSKKDSLIHRITIKYMVRKVKITIDDETVNISKTGKSDGEIKDEIYSELAKRGIVGI